MAPATPQIDVSETNRFLSAKAPEEIVRWAVDTFGDRLAVQSSMQKTAGVLMHMISRIAPQTEIIFIDTGVHFPETLQVRDEYKLRYGLNIQSYAPEKTFSEQEASFGRALHMQDDKPDLPGYRHCCFLRKEQPFINAVKGRFDAVIGGLMRSDGARRGNTEIINWDDRIQAYKVYPLAYWALEKLDEYTSQHDLPVHPLYALGYPSIGCYTCTTPVKPGEGPRAGRWRHIREQNTELAETPLYCGINREDRAPYTAAGI